MSQTKSAAPDLTAVHARLKSLLEPYRGRLNVAADGPGGMTLELRGYEGKPWGYAAGTRLGKRYVSYYLMGVYGDDRLREGMSPQLQKRMQGKSCFNFSKVDEALFAELVELTAKSIDRLPAQVEAALAARPRQS